MKKTLLTLFLFSTLTFNAAWAIDLGTAKSQGLVGETPNGYLAAVTSPSGEVKALINSINAQRKAQYEKIAKKNNTSLQAVESVAGEKAINKTAKGNFVLVGGKWKKK